MLKVRKYLLLSLLAGTVLILDLLTKQLVRTRLALGEVWMPVPALRPYLEIVYSTNTGAAFSLFQQGGLLFAVLAVLISGGIIYYYRNAENVGWLVRIALGLLLGGALGNLADRLTHGMKVADFIRFTFFPAVFNVADAALSLGIALLLLDTVLEYVRSRKAQSAPPLLTPPENG